MATPVSCVKPMRSPNRMKLAATMKAGATEPTTPMLIAVVYCSATNCRVPNAPPPVSDRKSMMPNFCLSFGQSRRMCPNANRLTSTNTTVQRTMARPPGGTCPAMARATTWFPAQHAAAVGSRT